MWLFVPALILKLRHPGVAVDVANGVSFGKGSINMSVNGANPEKNNFQMDGVAINNAAGNNMAMVAVGPRPGKTPTAVPRKTPMKQ